MQKNPKYSIIVPIYNAIKYIPTCIETVIYQQFSNYELIISDDNSNDGTTEYLHNLSHPNIKVVHPPHRLSMVEHFEWALMHASGEWCMFLGGDDGLQHYFFELAEQLTKMADDKNLRVIMSERAYFFWRGCELLYGKTAVGYSAKKQVKILDSRYQSLLALLGFQTYFELPEMYITSLFKKNLIDEAKSIMGGNLFSTIPPDANLGAIACSMEKQYLKSFIPLGWVGTSPGRLTPTSGVITDGMHKHGIKYDKTCGDFSIGSCVLYYWSALIRTEKLKSNTVNKILKSNTLINILFAASLCEIKKSVEYGKIDRINSFYKGLYLNKCNKNIVMLISYLLCSFRYIYWFSKRVLNYLYKLLLPSYRFKKDWGDGIDISLIEESKKIYDEVKKRGILDLNN